MSQKQATFDVDTRLKDAGLIAADDQCQVGGVDQTLDLGEGPSRVDGRVIIDATAVEVASGDEVYEIITEFSNESDFGSGIRRGPSMSLGDATALGAADLDNGVGQYELPCSNEIGGTIYRYMRLSVDVTGTIATGINFTAHFARAA